jgi:hypothetical protein
VPFWIYILKSESTGNADFLKELMDKCFNPIDQEGGGSSLIQSLLQRMGWDEEKYRYQPDAR